MDSLNQLKILKIILYFIMVPKNIEKYFYVNGYCQCSLTVSDTAPHSKIVTITGDNVF